MGHAHACDAWAGGQCGGARRARETARARESHNREPTTPAIAESSCMARTPGRRPSKSPVRKSSPSPARKSPANAKSPAKSPAKSSPAQKATPKTKEAQQQPPNFNGASAAIPPPKKRANAQEVPKPWAIQDTLLVFALAALLCAAVGAVLLPTSGLSGGLSGLFGSEAPMRKVTSLTGKAFSGSRLKRPKDGYRGSSLILLTNDDCEPCDQLNRVVNTKKMGRNLHKWWGRTLRVGRVVCSDPDSTEVCERFGVSGQNELATGYPYIMHFKDGVEQKEGYAGGHFCCIGEVAYAGGRIPKLRRRALHRGLRELGGLQQAALPVLVGVARAGVSRGRRTERAGRAGGARGRSCARPRRAGRRRSSAY